MGRIISGTILAMLMIMSMSCTYKKAETAFPSCDTTNVSYSGAVVPILVANCYSCHTQANSALGGYYVLDNYNDLSVQAQSGFLVGNITDPDINTKSHMPRNAPSLPDCEISKIRAWVNQGYKNN
jgi:mono/diheme cytochrome c family protein